MTEILRQQRNMIRIEVAIGVETEKGAGIEGEIGEEVRTDKGGKIERQIKLTETRSEKGTEIETEKKTIGTLMSRIEVGEIRKRKRTGIEGTIQRDREKGRDHDLGPLVGVRRLIKGKVKREVMIGIRQRTDMLIVMGVTKVELWKRRVIDPLETKTEFEKEMTEEEGIGSQIEGHLVMTIATKTTDGSICFLWYTESSIWSNNNVCRIEFVP